MFDPEDAAPGDTSSEDASKPGFQKAWSQWTSKPENNAALLQFGLAMLQPRSPGQSAIGAAANAVAEGGQAGGRVIAANKADEQTAAAEEDKQALRSNQRITAEAGANANNAYADNLRANGGAKGNTSAALKLQQGFRSYLVKPEDSTGLQVDPILGAVQKKFPNIKTKADLIADPAARAEAMRIYATVDPEADATTAPTPPVAASVAPPSGGLAVGTQKQFRDKATGAMKTFTWDGTQWK